MSRKLVATSAVFALAMLGLAGFASPAAALAGDTIMVTTTIQAAVDAAQPGDTILVPPGTYRESVLVTKSHLTITGSPAAIIDAEGFPTGIRVGTGRISRDGPVPTCPPLAVEGFTLKGLTITHGGFSGVFLVGVDGYRLTGTRYVDNPVYGPFPVCSRNGLIDFNQVVGGDSAGGAEHRHRHLCRRRRPGDGPTQLGDELCDRGGGGEHHPRHRAGQPAAGEHGTRPVVGGVRLSPRPPPKIITVVGERGSYRERCLPLGSGAARQPYLALSSSALASAL